VEACGAIGGGPNDRGLRQVRGGGGELGGGLRGRRFVGGLGGADRGGLVGVPKSGGGGLVCAGVGVGGVAVSGDGRGVEGGVGGAGGWADAAGAGELPVGRHVFGDGVGAGGDGHGLGAAIHQGERVGHGGRPAGLRFRTAISHEAERRVRGVRRRVRHLLDHEL